MTNQLKKFTFNQFLRVKIVISDMKEVKKSMIEMIESHGKIGLTILTRMNIKAENSDSSLMSNEMLKKNKERTKKQKSFQSTSDSQKSDNENHNNEKMHSMDCSACLSRKQR